MGKRYAWFMLVFALWFCVETDLNAEPSQLPARVKRVLQDVPENTKACIVLFDLGRWLDVVGEVGGQVVDEWMRYWQQSEVSGIFSRKGLKQYGISPHTDVTILFLELQARALVVRFEVSNLDSFLSWVSKKRANAGYSSQLQKEKLANCTLIKMPEVDAAVFIRKDGVAFLSACPKDGDEQQKLYHLFCQLSHTESVLQNQILVQLLSQLGDFADALSFVDGPALLQKVRESTTMGDPKAEKALELMLGEPRLEVIGLKPTDSALLLKAIHLSEKHPGWLEIFDSSKRISLLMQPDVSALPVAFVAFRLSVNGFSEFINKISNQLLPQLKAELYSIPLLLSQAGIQFEWKKLGEAISGEFSFAVYPKQNLHTAEDYYAIIVSKLKKPSYLFELYEQFKKSSKLSKFLKELACQEGRCQFAIETGSNKPLYVTLTQSETIISDQSRLPTLSEDTKYPKWLTKLHSSELESLLYSDVGGFLAGLHFGFFFAGKPARVFRFPDTSLLDQLDLPRQKYKELRAKLDRIKQEYEKLAKQRRDLRAKFMKRALTVPLIVSLRAYASGNLLIIDAGLYSSSADLKSNLAKLIKMSNQFGEKIQNIETKLFELEDAVWQVFEEAAKSQKMSK